MIVYTLVSIMAGAALSILLTILFNELTDTYVLKKQLKDALTEHSRLINNLRAK